MKLYESADVDKETNHCIIIIQCTKDVKQHSTMRNNAQFTVPYTHIYTFGVCNVKTSKQREQGMWKLILKSALHSYMERAAEKEKRRDRDRDRDRQRRMYLQLHAYKNFPRNLKHCKYRYQMISRTSVEKIKETVTLFVKTFHGNNTVTCFPLPT